MTHQNCKIRCVYKTRFHKSGHIIIKLSWQLNFEENNDCLSRLTIVSCEAKKQAVRDERVSYLQVAPLWK